MKNFHFSDGKNSFLVDDLDIEHLNITHILFDLEGQADHLQMNAVVKAHPDQTLALTYDSPKVDLSIKKSGKLWYGEESFLADKMIALVTNKAKQQQATIKDFSMHANQTQKNGRYNITFDTKADSFSNGLHEYGPVETKFSITGLDIAVLEKLLDHPNKITKAVTKRGKHITDFSNDLLPLLAQGLQVNMQTLRVESNVGDLQFQASLDIPKQPSEQKPSFAYILLTMKLNVHLLASQPMLQQIMEDYYRSVLKQAHLSEKTVKERAQQQIKAWVDSNILQRDGSNYSLNLKYANAVMSLNKK